MKITDFSPSPMLKPFVRCYRIVEGQESHANRVLPNTSVALAFRLGGCVSYSAGQDKGTLPVFTLSGLRKSVRLINYAESSSTLVVLFREGGASAFFREPMHELFEKTLALDLLIHPNELALIEEQLCEVTDNRRRAFIIDQFLTRRLKGIERDKVVYAAIEKLTSAKGTVRIHELLNTVPISADAFEKRFRKVVGTTPKQFASIVRMSHLVDQLEQKHDYLEAAFNAGFYDQSHFIRTFKTFTGQTPTDFLRSSSHW
jgi:AraC-like DNA-binding protein